MVASMAVTHSRSTPEVGGQGGHHGQAGPGRHVDRAGLAREGHRDQGEVRRGRGRADHVAAGVD